MVKLIEMSFYNPIAVYFQEPGPRVDLDVQHVSDLQRQGDFWDITNCMNTRDPFSDGTTLKSNLHTQ